MVNGEDGWRVTLNSGEVLSVDRVVLALDHFPPDHPGWRTARHCPTPSL